MNKATILCDASYNDDLHLGGFSGGYQIEREEGSWSDMYHGVTPEVNNSNEAEMMAIAGGAKKILDHIERYNGKIDAIDIHTDSYTAMNQYQLYVDGRQHDPKYTSPLNLMHNYLSKFPNANVQFHKVRSHVPAEEATPIEAFHNIVDKNALTVRWAAQKHLFEPKVEDSRYYGIILPSVVKEEQSEDLMQLGYAYAKQGMFARVSFLGKLKDAKDNPFLKGVEMVAKERNVDISTLMKIESVNRKGGRKSGCEGLDRALIRHHYRQQNKWANRVDFNIMPMMFAAVASRVMYGEQSLDLLNDSMLTGRKEQASKFVINVHSRKNMNKERPTYTNEWMNVFADYVNIPLQKGLSYAMSQLPLTPETTLEFPARKMREKIKSMMRLYQDDLSPAQLMGKMLEPIADEGFTLTRAQREDLTLLIEKCGRNVDLLSWRVAKETMGMLEGIKPDFSPGDKRNKKQDVVNTYKDDNGVEFHETPAFVSHDTPAPAENKRQNSQRREERRPRW